MLACYPIYQIANPCEIQKLRFAQKFQCEPSATSLKLGWSLCLAGSIENLLKIQQTSQTDDTLATSSSLTHGGRYICLSGDMHF